MNSYFSDLVMSLRMHRSLHTLHFMYMLIIILYEYIAYRIHNKHIYVHIAMYKCIKFQPCIVSTFAWSIIYNCAFNYSPNMNI